MKPYELEGPIIACWEICEDLKFLSKNSEDQEAMQVLDGIRRLYYWKFEELFNKFEKVCEEARLKN